MTRSQLRDLRCTTVHDNRRPNEPGPTPAVNELAEQDQVFRTCSAAPYDRRSGQPRTAAKPRTHAQDASRAPYGYPYNRGPLDS